MKIKLAAVTMESFKYFLSPSKILRMIAPVKYCPVVSGGSENGKGAQGLETATGVVPRIVVAMVNRHQLPVKMEVYAVLQVKESSSHVASINPADLKKPANKHDNRPWVLISGIFLALVEVPIKFAFFPNP
ncbi:hypothetical protein [Synechocystis sp. PCC 6714]|uniref:hypothetical protein n=1 Tax=Synechocystis sp. (strain PCC 6714) TaxID=1147 RepID=UPI00068B3275|nr:hypothetical protein [Synechocystis sp. PCC 6714]